MQEEASESTSPNALATQEEGSENNLEDLTAPLYFSTPSQAARLTQQVKEEDLILRLVTLLHYH